MFGLLLAVLALPGFLRGDLVFRCPGCTAENQDGCPKVTLCAEIVREPGCGCCPVCARLEGEFCGVYTPRCSTGLLCSPSMDAELPLQQLIQGFGRCTRSVEQDPSLDLLPTNGKRFILLMKYVALNETDSGHIQPKVTLSLQMLTQFTQFF